MFSKQVTIKAKTGLHARPATLFIKEAAKFESKILVKKDAKEIDAKSIIGILSLGAAQGTVIEIKAEGTDEKAAVEALVNLIENDINVNH